jgi:hypothetical protein
MEAREISAFRPGYKPLPDIPHPAVHSRDDHSLIAVGASLILPHTRLQAPLLNLDQNQTGFNRDNCYYRD